MKETSKGKKTHTTREDLFSGRVQAAEQGLADKGKAEKDHGVHGLIGA